MFSMKCFRLAALTLAALGFGLAGTDASAQHCGSQRSGSHGHVSAGYHGGGYSVSVSYGTSSHNSRSGYRCESSDRYGHSNQGYDRYGSSGRSIEYRSSGHGYANSSHYTTTTTYHSAPSGYWGSVYCPPVYETRYNHCGTPYRVCVSPGHYDRVWVSTGGGYCR